MVELDDEYPWFGMIDRFVTGQSAHSRELDSVACFSDARTHSCNGK